MLSYRRFDKESDYNIMRRIVQHNCLKTGQLYHQLHIGNLDFDRYAFEEGPDTLSQEAEIVSYNEREIGFIIAREDELIINVSSKFKHLTENILQYVEDNCYKKGEIVTIEANSEDTLLNSILEKQGYIKTDYFRFCGICDLSKIPSYSPLPQGFSIRLTENKDVKRRVELFSLATGVGTTQERYEGMMKSPSYGDAMDFVVETHDEEIIAYCTVWDDPISKIGVLEPVACVEKYRRRGIMKSTLLYGMNGLKERGTKYVYVGTGGGNIPSQALYRSVGFVDCGRNYEWQKTI